VITAFHHAELSVNEVNKKVKDFLKKLAHEIQIKLASHSVFLTKLNRTLSTPKQDIMPNYLQLFLKSMSKI